MVVPCMVIMRLKTWGVTKWLLADMSWMRMIAASRPPMARKTIP